MKKIRPKSRKETLSLEKFLALEKAHKSNWSDGGSVWTDLAISACMDFDAEWSARFPEGPDGEPPANMIGVPHDHAAIWRKVRSALAAHEAAEGGVR